MFNLEIIVSKSYNIYNSRKYAKGWRVIEDNKLPGSRKATYVSLFQYIYYWISSIETSRTK